jgi:hypothetical protein
MTIFRTAYDTQACQGFVLRHVDDGLKKADAMGYLRPARAGNFYEVTGWTAIEMATPGFAHPYVLSGEPPKLVVDMRPYGRWDSEQNEFRIRNASGAKLASTKAELTDFWLQRSPELLRDLSPLPLSMYCDFISKNVAKRKALDSREEQALAILAGWFYLSCFTNELELTERDRARFVQTIARTLYIPAEQVFMVTDKIPTALPSISAMCTIAQEVVDSVRLNDMNIGLFFQILSGAWYGDAAARETLLAALEHPPTGITQLYEREKPAVQKQFLHAVLGLLNNEDMKRIRDEQQLHVAVTAAGL